MRVPGLLRSARGALLVAALMGHLPLLAQRTTLVLDATEQLPKRWRAPRRVASPLEGEQALRTLLNDLRAVGHLAASIDSCIPSGDTLRCHVHIGERSRWAHLSGSGIPPEIASRVRFRERTYTGRPVTPRQTVRVMEDLLRYAEEHGHPFAEVRLDSVRIHEDGWHAAVVLVEGRTVHIDSVVLRGTARLSSRYLQQHIGIRPGALYDEALIVALDRRVRELPFVAQKQKPYVLFTPETTKLYLFLDAKKASTVNGILGVLPDPVTGKVNLTGDIDLRLRNALRRGEAIELNWRSMKDRTQDLKVRLQLPFLFNTPCGTDLSLKLFRRDTSFLEVTGRAAVQFSMAQGDVISVFVNSKSSRVLGRIPVFSPGLANVKLLTYGLGLERQRLDYRPNPQRGYALVIEGSLGNKESRTPDPDNTVLTITTRSVQYEVIAQAILHVKLGRRGTVRIAGQGGAMVNPNLYVNELYRLGGIKNMRGVDEASIYASSYAIGTLEYRILLEENSNAFVFVDQAWWEDLSGAEPLRDDPIGFGVGTSFETKAGIFSLTYALASQFNVPVELRSGKIHFGFTSLF